MKSILERALLLGTSTAQVKTMNDFAAPGIKVILADCTLGEEWAAWGECEPANGTCGNGTRERFKEELLPARNGGTCFKDPDPQPEECYKSCPPPINTTGSIQLEL